MKYRTVIESKQQEPQIIPPLIEDRIGVALFNIIANQSVINLDEIKPDEIKPDEIKPDENDSDAISLKNMFWSYKYLKYKNKYLKYKKYYIL